MGRSEQVPSKAQARVLERITDGWELAASTTMNGRSWIQHGGAGKGGQSEGVNGNTFASLCQRGWVDGNYNFPTARYWITDAGRAALKRYRDQHTPAEQE